MPTAGPWVAGAERAVDDPDAAGVAAVIEDDRRDRAGGAGVVGLLAERAGAALHERDRPRRHAGEVGGLAAGRRGPGPGAAGATRSTAQTAAVVAAMEPENVIDEKSTPST